MKLSKHAEHRIRKRIGIKKKIVEKIKDKAFNKGITHSQVKGRLRKYFDYLYLSHKTATNIRIYINYVRIFSNNTLITVFPLSSYYIKKLKRKINNEK